MRFRFDAQVEPDRRFKSQLLMHQQMRHCALEGTAGPGSGEVPRGFPSPRKGDHHSPNLCPEGIFPRQTPTPWEYLETAICKADCDQALWNSRLCSKMKCPVSSSILALRRPHSILSKGWRPSGVKQERMERPRKTTWVGLSGLFPRSGRESR